MPPPCVRACALVVFALSVSLAAPAAAAALPEHYAEDARILEDVLGLRVRWG